MLLWLLVLLGVIQLLEELEHVLFVGSHVMYLICEHGQHEEEEEEEFVHDSQDGVCKMVLFEVENITLPGIGIVDCHG